MVLVLVVGATSDCVATAPWESLRQLRLGGHGTSIGGHVQELTLGQAPSGRGSDVSDDSRNNEQQRREQECKRATGWYMYTQAQVTDVTGGT